MVIDLNCDMGESFGSYYLGRDQEVIPHISSANVACGFHASDPLVMRDTVELALDHGVGVGAHPGYPDLRGFGRRNIDCTREEVQWDAAYQISALMGIARSLGASLQHVKPHGALYNTAAGHEPTARAVCQAIKALDPGLILICLAGPGGEVVRRVAGEESLTVAQEAFADRAYLPDGRLVPRSQEGAMLHHPGAVAARCVAMATQGTVEAVDGSLVRLSPHTICVHGDNQAAVELVKRVRQGLKAAGVEIKPLGSFLG